MSRKNEVLYPYVKVTNVEEGQRQANDQYALKDFAKKLAQRRYSPDDNPAIKRLQQRFKGI